MNHIAAARRDLDPRSRTYPASTHAAEHSQKLPPPAPPSRSPRPRSSSHNAPVIGQRVGQTQTDMPRRYGVAYGQLLGGAVRRSAIYCTRSGQVAGLADPLPSWHRRRSAYPPRLRGQHRPPQPRSPSGAPATHGGRPCPDPGLAIGIPALARAIPRPAVRPARPSPACLANGHSTHTAKSSSTITTRATNLTTSPPRCPALLFGRMAHPIVPAASVAPGG